MSLHANVLGPLDAAAQSFGMMSPIMASTLLMSQVARWAGDSTPLALVRVAHSAVRAALLDPAVASRS